MSYTANSNGGRYNHSHIYGMKYKEVWYSQYGFSIRNMDGSFSGGAMLSTSVEDCNNGTQQSKKAIEIANMKMEADTSLESTMQPYITVFFWRRLK